MIIFGTTGLTFSGESGQFFCPECASHQAYQRKTVRRFFTLYFIPLIPLDTISTYVRCHHCDGTFHPEVLSLKESDYRAAMEAEFFDDVRRVMVLMMLADGRVEENEVLALVDFYRQLTGTEVPRSQIDQEVEQAKQAKSDAVSYVRRLAPRLGEQGKRTIVQGAFLVASAGGEMDPGHQQQLRQFPEALGISTDAFRQYIAEVS